MASVDSASRPGPKDIGHKLVIGTLEIGGPLLGAFVGKMGFNAEGMNLLLASGIGIGVANIPIFLSKAINFGYKG